MRRFLCCIIIAFALLFTGCTSKISLDDYNNLEAENQKLLLTVDTLKTENEALENQYGELQENYSLISKENKTNENLSNEYMKLYMDAIANGDDIVTQAWGEATFGDSTKFVRIDKDTVQYSAVIDEISQEKINDIFSKFKDFAGALSPVMETENTKYTYIKITDSNSLPIFELFIDISNGTDNSKIDILMNELYDDLVKSAVNEIF